MTATQTFGQNETPIVIAHRGASGYLPEHTLAAKALAYGMGADFIEQDVVLTCDDVPIVLHDVYLDAVTNVRSVFPDRARSDGRFYAIDFSLEDIRSLRVHQRIDIDTGKSVYPARFPVDKSVFRIATLADEIELIQGLNKSTGCTVGIYPEIKKPSWHRQQGKDISRIVVELLEKYGYRDKQDSIYLQCFDPGETFRIRNQLRSKLKLVQLIGNNKRDNTVDYDWMRTPPGLKRIAEYADGIGPDLKHVVADRNQKDGSLEITDLVKNAHDLGLVVHPYTFRSDSLPAFAATFEDLVRIFLKQARVDGFFTDFPDKVSEAIRR